MAEELRLSIRHVSHGRWEWWWNRHASRFDAWVILNADDRAELAVPVATAGGSEPMVVWYDQERRTLRDGGTVAEGPHHGYLLLIAAEGGDDLALDAVEGNVVGIDTACDSQRHRRGIVAAVVLRPGQAASIRDGDVVRKLSCVPLDSYFCVLHEDVEPAS